MKYRITYHHPDYPDNTYTEYANSQDEAMSIQGKWMKWGWKVKVEEA